MSDRPGDKSKQPPECEPRFIPWGPENPKPNGEWGQGRWTKCPNLKDTSSPSDMNGETYDCAVCGQHYRLYYEDMA